MKLLPLLAIALATLPAPAHAGLSGPERRMIQTVERERERTIELLERLVNQNSGSLNLPGVEAVGKMMRAELEPLGFETRWIPMAETGRAGHLVAVHKGNSGGKRLLLPRTSTHTMKRDGSGRAVPSHSRIGIYRDPAIQGTAHVLFDEYVIASSPPGGLR